MDQRQLTEKELNKAKDVLSNYTYSLTTNGQIIEIADVDGDIIIGEVSISVLDGDRKINNEDITFTQ